MGKCPPKYWAFSQIRLTRPVRVNHAGDQPGQDNLNISSYQMINCASNWMVAGLSEKQAAPENLDTGVNGTIRFEAFRR